MQVVMMVLICKNRNELMLTIKQNEAVLTTSDLFLCKVLLVQILTHCAHMHAFYDIQTKTWQ